LAADEDAIVHAAAAAAASLGSAAALGPLPEMADDSICLYKAAQGSGHLTAE